VAVGPSEQNAEAEPVPVNKAHSVNDKTAAARTAAGTTEKAAFTTLLNQIEMGLASAVGFASIDTVNFLPVPFLEML